MKLLHLTFPALISLLALSLLGCGDGPSQKKVDATKPLEQSFQQAEPEVKQAIQSVNESLKGGNYQQALTALALVVTPRKLTAEQVQAVGAAVKQADEAAAANPALDTPELYKARLRLMDKLHTGR